MFMYDFIVQSAIPSDAYHEFCQYFYSFQSKFHLYVKDGSIDRSLFDVHVSLIASAPFFKVIVTIRFCNNFYLNVMSRVGT